MKKWTNRLEKLCSLFGWQGGTIFQACDELKSCVKSVKISVDHVLNCSDQDFEQIVYLYSQNKKVG